jgi:protoporphyrinogen oxidase
VGDAAVDLAVLGAGPAGLAAAWWAAGRGLSVLVLERAPAVGGMTASFDVAGVRVDFGSHRLHPATPPELLAALRAELGEELRLRPRNGRLRVYGRWVAFPLRAGELVRALPPSALRRIARDALCAPLRPRRDTSFGAALSARLGPELYGELYAPYARKLWGLDANRIDAEQARRRVTADSPWAIAARLLRRDRTGQGRAFWYPRRGFGQIADALAAAAVRDGATIRTGAEVSTVDIRGERPAVRLAGGETIHCGHIASTVPLPLLAKLVRPSAPAPVLDAAGGLAFRAMVLVYLVHEGGRWSPYDAHYLPGPQTPVTRISEPANYRDSPDDPTDRTVLCAEIPCSTQDPLWTMSDGDLAGIVTAGIRATGLPPVRLAGVAVRRLPHVYPVYDLGYRARLEELDRWATGLDRVTTFGRLGLFAHDNTHHALVMARAAVAALRDGGQRDPAAWAGARRRFAEHVVED